MSDVIIPDSAATTEVVEPTIAVEGEPTEEGAAADSGADKPVGEADDKKFTQVDVDRILGERLSRQKAEAEKDKADAKAWREYQDSQKDEATRNSEEMERLRNENSELKMTQLRADVVAEKKVPPKMAKFLSGNTREELEAAADELLEAMPAAVSAPGSSKPTPVNPESKKLGVDETPFDPKDIVARIPRG